MSEEQRREHNALQDVADPYDGDDAGGGDDGSYEQDVLRGNTTADISHAGEAMTEEDVEQADSSLLEKLRDHHKFVLWFYFLGAMLIIIHQ